jgi:hypothetical protein
MPRTYDASARQVMHELQHDVNDMTSGIVFARVTRIVTKPEWKVDEGKDTEGYSHWFGFANQVHANSTTQSKSGQVIWFKKNDHMPTMFFGPVVYKTSCRTTVEMPAKHDIVMGSVHKTEKGWVFTHWTHGAEPFLCLKKLLLHHTRLRPTSGKLYDMLTLEHGTTPDDMYILARVLLFGDVHLLSDMLTQPDRQEYHPLKKKVGHTLTRGYSVHAHAVEFAFLLSLLARNTEILEAFHRLLQDHVPTQTTQEMLAQFSMDKLKLALQNNR